MPGPSIGAPVPEGDTVLAAANRLHKILANAGLTQIELRWPTVPPHVLDGRQIIEVGAYAKHLLMRFDDGQTLRTHLKMDGQWKITPATGRPATGSPYARAILGTAQWTCTGYRLGMLDLWQTAQEPVQLAHMGPDVLADSFVPSPLLESARTDPARFLAPRLSHAGLGMAIQKISDEGWLLGLERFTYQRQDRPIAETLLDQTVVSGIGTIFMAEGLFKHRINPWRALADVPLEPLLASIRANLIRGVIFPMRGRIIHVHGKQGQPCVRCGSPIARELVGPPLKERPAFFCPTCQPE